LSIIKDYNITYLDKPTHWKTWNQCLKCVLVWSCLIYDLLHISSTWNIQNRWVHTQFHFFLSSCTYDVFMQSQFQYILTINLEYISIFWCLHALTISIDSDYYIKIHDFFSRLQCLEKTWVLPLILRMVPNVNPRFFRTKG
jgi:hypothetical protein